MDLSSLFLGFSTNQNAVYRWTINAAFRASACQQLPEFVKYHNSKQVHKDLQVSRINRDLDDVQGVFDLLNESLINPVERKELVSLSSGVFPGNQIVADLDQAYEKGKKCMENFINDRLISLEKSNYTPIKKLRLGKFSKIKTQVTFKIKGKNVQFNYQSDLFG